MKVIVTVELVAEIPNTTIMEKHYNEQTANDFEVLKQDMISGFKEDWNEAKILSLHIEDIDESEFIK